MKGDKAATSRLNGNAPGLLGAEFLRVAPTREHGGSNRARRADITDRIESLNAGVVQLREARLERL